MAAETKIKFPKAKKRPDSALSDMDVCMLEVYLFTNLKFWEVWSLFKGIETTNRSKQQASAFLSTFDAQNYIQDRVKQINDFITPAKPEVQPEKQEEGEGVITEGDVTYVGKLIMQYAKDPSSDLHFDAIKMIAPKIIDFLKNMTGQKPPERYLPETCSHCRFKRAIEEQCDDDCDLCKYKLYANEHGVEYTPQTQLKNESKR